MTTTKNAVTRKRKVVKPTTENEETYQFIDTPTIETSVSTKTKKPNQKLIYAGLAIALGILAILVLNKQWLIAAIVNGQPIFRWDLNTVLANRYGEQTLDGIITEQLIISEARNNSITITQEEIDTKGEEILASFGSTLSVDEFLKLQGLSRNEFDSQLRLQLMVQRILTKDLEVSDDMIQGFIASNAAVLVATEPAALKAEAKNAIIEQKVAETFEEWLQNLRAKATVQKFL